MTSDGILDEIKELNAIKVARENEVSRLREIFEENQKNEGDLFQKDILAFENWEKGFSLSDFRVEIFSDDKFTLVISGKQSPNIMKSILTACGMKVDGRTKKISANQMTLVEVFQELNLAKIDCLNQDFPIMKQLNQQNWKSFTAEPIRFSMTTEISYLLSRKNFWNMKRC